MKEVLEDSVTYFIGENAKENDELYEKMPSNAIWFHLDSKPSAHVYAVSLTKMNRIQLKRGASFVRFYSKGQGRVLYAEKKDIKLIGQGLVELLKNPKII